MRRGSLPRLARSLRPWSATASAAAVLLGLAACSGGGGGGDGTNVGPGAHPQVARVEFGRLVDVYGLRVTPQGTTPDLYKKDVLIGGDIQDERQPGDNKRDDEVLYDFTSSDPDTLQPRLFIPRSIDSDAFRNAFDALDDQVREVAPLAFGGAGPGRTFSVVPRNAAIRVRFDANLAVDDSFFVLRDEQGRVTGLRNTEAVQLLQIAGDPSQPGAFRPLPARIIVEPNALILDPVLLGTEGLQYQTRNSAAGMPASPDQTGANIRIAIALDGPLAIPGLRADSVESLTGANNSGFRSIIRDFRSGNANDSSADIARGFVRDPIPPRIVGEIPMLLESVDPVNAFTQEIVVYKNSVNHDIDRGDVIRFVADTSGVPFASAEVVADPEDDRNRPAIQHVRVRIRLVPDLESIDPQNNGYPATDPLPVREAWLRANAPKAVLVTEFQAGGRVDPQTNEQLGDDPRYFATFSPTPLPNPDGTPSEPDENVSPFAAGVIRFTKPVDMDTVNAADTLFFATRNLLDPLAINDFILTRPWELLNDANPPVVIASGTGMDPAAFDENKFRTPHLVAAGVTDEDGSQTALRLQPGSGFYLDDAMRQPNGNLPYFFHLLGGSSGIRDLAGNPLDLQADVVERANQIVIPFTLDVRETAGRPQFDNNIAVSCVRRHAARDEDEQPSYYIPSEVQGSGNPNARAFPLDDLFGAFVLLDGTVQGRPTTRVRQIADNLNQAPVATQGTPLQWCPVSVGGEQQVAANTSTTPFGQGIQNPLNPNGCRLQTVWREIDLSLSRIDPFDFNLDVEQMYWAPLATGTITFDEFDRLSLFLGHSERRPEPCVGNFSALASLPNSGLLTRFDDNFVRNLRPTGTNQVESRPQPFGAYVDKPMRIDAALSVYEPNRVNRFLPLPEFQEPYFVYRDETVVEQGCQSSEGSDINSRSTYDPFIISPWNNGIGRRAVQTGTQIGFMNGFWNSALNHLPRVSGTSDLFTEGLVGNIALPLLADFWTYCDSPDLPEGNGYIALGTNGWQISITLQSGAQPNFRVLSAGRPATSAGPGQCLTTGSNEWSNASGGWTPPPNPSRTASGDNSLYWIMIDFLKRQSVLTSGFVDLANPHRVPAGFADTRLGPFYLANGQYAPPQNVLPEFTYEIDPPLTQLPGGTSIVPQFRGASRVDPSPWYWEQWVQANATLYTPANLDAQLRPDATNFPLDPYKACDAHIRKYDDRLVGTNGPAKNYWTYLYNRTVTQYVTDPNTLMQQSYTTQFASPNEGFLPRDVRYVNWRFVMSNNTEANPPVTPSIDTFSLSYRFRQQPNR